MKNSDQMKEGEDFKFDAEKQVLCVYNLDEYATYRLFIYINNQYINRRRELYQNSKRTDRPKL